MEELISSISMWTGACGRSAGLLFTADHSFDLGLPRGKRGENIVPLVEVKDSHTAEEVLVAAEGPGADRIHGYMCNTQLFDVMMAAYGWKP